MKKHILIFYTLILVSFFACDVISEGDRIVEMDEIIPLKNVLLVEFTDQYCLNCPIAAKEIVELKEAFGVAVIPVGMHVSSKPLPLVTREGNDYEKYFDIEVHPTALIDGIEISNNYQAWGGLVLNRFNVKSDVKLTLDLDYNLQTRKLDVNVKIYSEYDHSHLKLFVWLVESGIVSAQKMPDGTTNSEYIHNHVFRGVVSEMWGDELSTARELDKQYQCELQENWNFENTSIVGFIYNSKTNEVLDVAETYIMVDN